ncbi:hypothetical protein [Piscibacillus halophilus]|uniref:hypothetical protein n=1 Tax=Piscibacillus halophilus TaxID=571933 RepID=UPI00240A4430|nr:hypothetical protein [Piscibacillus halophilus]
MLCYHWDEQIKEVGDFLFLTFADLSAWFLIAVAVVIIVNVIKYKSGLKRFDWLVLALLVMTNVVFLILSNFDPYAFNMLWKQFLVLTISAVILNYFFNLSIESRMSEKGKEIEWQEDQKIVRSLLIVGSIGLFGFLVYTIWYTTPTQIDKSLEGIHFQLEDPDTEEMVMIEIEGELERTIKGGGFFEGELTIQGSKTTIPQDDLKVNIDYRDNEEGMLLYFSDEDTHLAGNIFVHNDFEQVVIHDEDGSIVAAPASDQDEALDLARDLTGDEI